MQTTYYVEQLNEMAKKDSPLLVLLSKQNYENQIEELANKFQQENNKQIILIAGPSSSGKTTTCNLISQKLRENGKNVLEISLDDFFINRDKTPLLPDGNYDYENITAIDLEYLNIFINDLQTTQKGFMPRYNFKTGKREAVLEETIIDENTILVIEGLHAINPNLLKNQSKNVFRVYISVNSCFKNNDEMFFTHTQTRLMRRMIRDIYGRAKSIEDTLSHWNNVLDGERMFIDPYKADVDFVVDSTHMSEIFFQAKYLLPLILNNKKTAELAQKLSILQPINKDLLTEDSLLNEFFNS